MAELIKEQIFLDQSIGSEDVQIMLEGDLIVPDTKPDIASLLQTDERIVITRTEASTDRVNYLGSMHVSLLYLAKEASKTVQSIDLVRNLDDFVNLDGATKDVRINTKATISNIDYRVINDRKVNYRAVVSLSITAESSDAHEMVVHISDIPVNQQQKANLNINRTVENITDRFSVTGQITLPPAKPNFAEILQTSIGITNRDARVGSGRVNLTGELHFTTLYRSDAEDSRIEFLEYDLPFNGPIDVNGARENMLADVNLQVLDQSIVIRPDEDGEDRVLDIEVSIGVDAKVYSAETISVLDDAYSINQTLMFERTPVRYPNLVCINANQTAVREVVTLSETSPDMLQVFRVKGVVHVDDIRTVDDKVIVEGAINTDILYVAESDATPLASFRTVLPYRQVIEAKGAAADMRIGVDVATDTVTFNMLSPREVEVRFQLTFNTNVVKEETASIIGNVDITDIEPEVLATQPSMRVYIVQPGDDLWKVAKRFNTPLDELLAVNEIENPGKVAPGTKLLLLKNAV